MQRRLKIQRSRTDTQGSTQALTAPPMFKLKRMLRRGIGRPFTDPALEHEFIGAFRTIGASFVAIATALAGLGVCAFLLIEFANGKGFASPQPLRLILTVALLGTAYFAKRKDPFFLRHYAIFGSAVIVIAASAAYLIAFKSRPPNGGPMLYWTLTSGSVLATIIIYGFMRLQSANTLVLGIYNIAVATAFAAMAEGETAYLYRMVVHLLAANVACFSLYRLVVGRERRLFLQAKRKQNVAELRPCRSPCRGGDREGRGGEPSQVLVSRQHEPRDPNAHERHHRHARTPFAGVHALGGRDTHQHRQELGRGSSARPQPDPRSLQARCGRPDAQRTLVRLASHAQVRAQRLQRKRNDAGGSPSTAT